MTVHYPREMVGYGATPIEARWRVMPASRCNS